MNILNMLIKESKYGVLLCALFSFAAGVSKGMLMVIITEVISTQNFFSTKMIIYFMLLVGVTLLFRFINNVYIVRLVEGITMKFRLHILNELRKTEFSDFEKIGHEEIHNALTQDCITISHNVPEIIRMISAFITMFVCLIYIITLSMSLFYMTAAVFAIGALLYLVRQSTAKENLTQARTEENSLYKLILDFLLGFQELRMNRVKCRDLYDNHIEPEFNKTRIHRIKGLTSIEINYMLGLLFFFCFIGVVIFSLPHWGAMSLSAVSKIAIILLYMIDPGGDFFYGALQMTGVKIAIDNIEKLMEKNRSDKRKIIESAPTDGPAEKVLKPQKMERFKELRLEGVTYSYLDTNAPAFSIGPINLRILRGETVFITGGNGSGKTTLSKILTGLYTPMKGGIRVDDTLLTNDLNGSYRILFSALFNDYYLFDRIYGPCDLDDHAVREHLVRLSLDKKVDIHNGRFSTLNLSAGQRRRLALLVVLLEDHPVFVFDELTADQDAEFTQCFYEQIMLRLKEKGKTIVNITHNESYFHLADKLVRMEYGKILEVS